VYVIPAIDLMGGEVVRLTEGKFESKQVYALDPVQQALKFEAQGYQRLHLVDLDGARGRGENVRVLSQITRQTSLQVDFSGGIRTRKKLERVWQAGAGQVVIGSLAISQPGTVRSWLEEFGGEKIILAADVRGEQLVTQGWEQESDWRIWEFIREWQGCDLRYILCTDVSRDGALQGPNWELYKNLVETFPDLKIIASGGVSSQADVEQLQKIEVYGVVVGKWLLEKP
jgi:phosphoribosylformimino-5-aminoimidazole carboxamide ribotide isomerase